MKPGHIQVFDGLRLTTEHMNHLQGSFHTALQDVRRILGLGKVFYGFEVVRNSENKVTVTPGLAFDRKENRIVCDEPKTLDVEFQDNQKSLYVCIKYDQVQEGIVESTATLIYDSCTILILPDLSEPNENLIVIAELQAKDGNGDFSIVFPTPDDLDVKPGIDNEAEINADETLVQTTRVLERSLECGVIHLNSEPDQKIPIDNALIEALKNNLNQEAKLGHIRFAQFSSIELPIPFQPCALVFDIVLRADIGVETEETAGTSAVWNYLSTSHAEAVIEKDSVRQYGTVMLHGKTRASMPVFQLIDADITQEGIVQIQFKPCSQIPDELEYLRYLGLNVFVQCNAKGSQFIVTSAIWKGTISEGVIDAVIKHKPYVRWEANAAWKAYRTITQNQKI